MRITILGAGTGIPAEGHSPAGVYVRTGREHLVFDAGAGTLQRLRRLGVTFLDVDRLFLTHFHPDHCLDLVSFLFAMRIPMPPRRKPFTVYGPRGLRKFHQGLQRVFPSWLTPRGYRVTLRELGETQVRIPQATVTTRRMRHSAPALGYRVTFGGKTVAYSGDTDTGEGILTLGQGADLLILECAMPDRRKVAGHLTPSECGRIAAVTRCRHLLLTHFYPVFRPGEIEHSVRCHFRGRLTLARDFTTVHL